MPTVRGKILIRIASYASYLSIILCFLVIEVQHAQADLAQIKKDGVLRHLGVPYSNFVTGSGDGFSADLIRGFAEKLGVRYEFVETDWKNVISDLTGKMYEVGAGDPVITGTHQRRGDLIANGLTILPWRNFLIDYSNPTFPSGVWLIAGANSPLKPIIPTGDLLKDIKKVKSRIKGVSILCMLGTCLDPALYNLEKTGAKLVQVSIKMNEFAPAVVNQRAQASLLDVADALIALEKWPGKIKVIGPLSPPQEMGVGFRKEDCELRKEFNKYLADQRANGRHMELVVRYYPDATFYFPDFFSSDE